MYAEVMVVVDGAMEEAEEFSDDTLMMDYIRGIEEEQRDHGYPVEVFVLEHEHEPTGDECACAQYAQDHRPRYSFCIGHTDGI
jgi:hypothetical protein